MSRHISPVLEIRPGGKKSWTVLVQVVENAHVQQSRQGNDFKRLVLTDSEGTKFNALIYSYHLRYFACLLVQYKRYYISNAILNKCEPRYRISTYEYSWVLNNRTLVEELVESVPMTLPCRFEFTSFSDLHKYADTDQLQNVKAIVLHCFPSQEQGSEITTRRDVVLVNEEKKLLLLTLWNQFDEKEGSALANMMQSGPLIYGMRLKVTTFNSLSLTTRASSGLMINPPTVDDTKLKEWYNDNKDELQQLLEMKTYKDTDLLFPYPKEADIISVATAASSLNTRKTAWVKGKTTLVNQERSFWYTACSNCQKSLDADLTWVVTCPSCKLQSDVKAISRILILIDDGTASIRATISTPKAEKLMPFTAVQLKEADELGIDLHDDIAASIRQHEIAAFIRSYETTFQGQNQTKISVVKAHKPREVLPSSNLISLPTSDQLPESTSNVPSETTRGKGKEQAHILLTPSKPIKRSSTLTIKDIEAETIAKRALPIAKKEGGVSAHVTDETPTKKTKESSV